MSSLNPVFSIGMQVREPLSSYHGVSGKALARRAVELSRPSESHRPRRGCAPSHTSSRGMRQRVVGAMAISAPPRLLIATSRRRASPHDPGPVSSAAQDLQERYRLAMIFVTHNLGIVAKMLRPRWR